MIILAQSRSVWFLLPRFIYRWFSSLYQTEESTMLSIREFAKSACANAQPGSPLHSLQSHPLYTDTDTRSRKNLVDEAITLLFAGQDTSAATLSWTLHLLSLHVDVQAKLTRELVDVVGSDPKLLSRKDLSKLPYLDAVIKESMRLYPVAPFVVRKVGESAASQLRIPKGTLACVWIYCMHRHPDYWSDPDDFRPERWLTKECNDITSAYIPFAAGPRNCVGQPLANIVLRVVLARLVLRFDFRDDRVERLDKKNHSCQRQLREQLFSMRKDMQAGFTVLPEGGVDLMISLR